MATIETRPTFSNSPYQKILNPLLDLGPSEEMHIGVREGLFHAQNHPLALALIRRIALGKELSPSDQARLATDIGSLHLANSYIVAAGWDKPARAVRGLIQGLGFAAVEVGAVLPRKQTGNPHDLLHPRQKVIKYRDTAGVVRRGVTNWLGLNCEGADAVVENLKRYKDEGLVIGINVAINNGNWSDEEAAEQFAEVVEKTYDYASYFTYCVSCPNCELHLTSLQRRRPLDMIVKAGNRIMDRKGGRKDTYIKTVPMEGHLEEAEAMIYDVVQVVVDNDLRGLVTVNTTVDEAVKVFMGKQYKAVPGGASGDIEPYRRKALMTTAYAQTLLNEINPRRAKDKQIVQMGVGALTSPEACIERTLAGASAKQFNGSIRTEGPGIVQEMSLGELEWMDKNGVDNMSQVVGVEAETIYRKLSRAA